MGELDNINTQTIKDLTATGQSIRRPIALPAGEIVSLDAHGLTPKWWFFRNTGTELISLNFGGALDLITLAPEEPSFIRTAVIPTARSLHETNPARLIYAVFE